jgi:hypothetical protein
MIMTKVTSRRKRTSSSEKEGEAMNHSEVIESTMRSSLLSFAGVWAGEEFDVIEKVLGKQREENVSREYELQPIGPKKQVD